MQWHHMGVVLLVGTRKGAFFIRSPGTRDSWRVRGPSLKGWRVADIQRAADDDSRLFAAVGHFVYGETIHQSDDLGETWVQVEHPPSFDDDDDRTLNQIWTVTPGYGAHSGVLYAGVDDAGLFQSTDGGKTWTELSGLVSHETRPEWVPGNGGLCLHSIVPHPEDRDRLWVAISAVGVFHTRDGGETWELQNRGVELIGEATGTNDVGSCVHRLIQDPTNPEHLVQQNHVGVYRTTTGGEEWTRIDQGLPSSFGFPIVMHPRLPETLYTFPLESSEYRMSIDGQPAVYRTTDAGSSWEELKTGLPSDNWVTVLRHGMATDTLDPAGVYVGTTSGQVFYSRDAGETWNQIDCALPRIYSVNAIEVP